MPIIGDGGTLHGLLYAWMKCGLLIALGPLHLAIVARAQVRRNRHASKWAFAELHSYIVYKATLGGSMAIKVDAHFISQACPMCGSTSTANRPYKGLLFVCHSCHYSLYVDLVGVRNITMRTLPALQDWNSTGYLSVAPVASDDEANAAWRERYAALRWSPDASLRL